jgi:hypothetical protein
MKSVLTVFSFFLTTFVFANNIQLQKVSLSDTNRTAKTVNIKMNISWDHSWRDSINWDAAWIIIKYKEPKDNLWKWKHAQLSIKGNNAGTSPGVKIVVPDDGTGAFFYRSEIGFGSIASENVKLVWNYGSAGVANIDSVEVRVFATEMVFIPQGNYCLGDGNGTSRSDNAFQLKSARDNYAVITDKWSPLINTSNPSYGFSPVGDDAAVYINGIRISGLDGIDMNNDKVADFPNFPTGYRSFYCMKYKVTQGQYADFLNTVCANDTATAALDAYLNQPVSQYFGISKLEAAPKELKAIWLKLGDLLGVTDDQRHTIKFDPPQLKFTVSRPDRAYSLMDMNKGLAFSEWFGLRPMSELEFEKTSRGPLPPVLNEKSWGEDSKIPLYYSAVSTSLTLSGIENGTEYFSNYDITKRNFLPYSPNGSFNSVTGGDGGVGPYRVGIYANDTSSRLSSGAGYYGVMDMSKISGEFVLPVSTAENRSFNYNTNGKGVLSAIGNNYSFVTTFGTSFPSSIFRNYFVSKRGNINPTLSNSGFRAVRLAPSDN